VRRLREIWERPIPAERSLVVFAAAATILLLAAAPLTAIPGRSTDTEDSAVVEAVPAEPNPVRELENTVEIAARRFMVGYLPLASGHGDLTRVEAASQELLRRLDRPLRVPPAAQHRHPRLVEVEAGPISAGRTTVAATVKSGGITFPVILGLELIQGRWLVTRVGAE
jgi:hypothetical protein